MCVFDSASTISSTISMISSIVQSAWSIYSKVETIKVTNKQAEININAARRNAEIARQNAILERQEALENARLQRLKTIQNISALKTTIASGNIDLGSETALDLIDSVSQSGELDALNILKKGEENARKQLLEAKKYDEKADFYISQSVNSFRKAAGALLGQGLSTTTKAFEI